MIGGLSLSVAEIGVDGIATYWFGIVQPVMAVHIVKLSTRSKASIRIMEIVELRANMKAAQIRDTANDQRLELAER